MIKAVFFDWFNTLATYDPPREDSYRKAFLEFGIEISLQKVHKGLLAGDRQFFSLNSRSLISGKSLKDRLLLFVCYPQSIAHEAGIAVTNDIQLQILQKVLKEFTNNMVLYQDVLPNIRRLKEAGLVLGIITNAEKSVNTTINNVGLTSFLNFVVTSEEAGAEKPSPVIFNKSLEISGMQADDVIYVGDQYTSDILGARSAGIKGILIDRYDVSPDLPDCPKIQSLDNIFQSLKYLDT